MTPQGYKELSKTRRTSALLFSLILHLTLAIIFVFIPREKVIKEKNNIAVEWVKDAPKPRLRRPKTKPSLKMRAYKPDKRLALDAKEKLVKSSPNKIIEVVSLSDRIVHQNIEANKAAPSERIPELMTDAELRDAEASNLERLITHAGRTDGQGEVTGRVRVRGQRDGLSLVDSLGDVREGQLGGGGNPGVADRLDIIKFLNEFDGVQKVVYCLDVSSSMQAAGLRKLELAIESIKDSLLMLGDDDDFNIISFSARAKFWKRKLVLATMDNVEKASQYLDRFTPQQIANNHGTNLLEAVEKALKLNPSIIVLVTDGLPTASRDEQDDIETNSQKILTIVKEKNVNHASIYVVGIEIDPRRSPGAKLLVYLTDQNNGKLKLIDRDQLIKRAASELTVGGNNSDVLPVESRR